MAGQVTFNTSWNEAQKKLFNICNASETLSGNNTLSPQESTIFHNSKLSKEKQTGKYILTLDEKVQFFLEDLTSITKLSGTIQKDDSFEYAVTLRGGSIIKFDASVAKKNDTSMIWLNEKNNIRIYGLPGGDRYEITPQNNAQNYYKNKIIPLIEEGSTKDAEEKLWDDSTLTPQEKADVFKQMVTKICKRDNFRYKLGDLEVAGWDSDKVKIIERMSDSELLAIGKDKLKSILNGCRKGVNDTDAIDTLCKKINSLAQKLKTNKYIIPDILSRRDYPKLDTTCDEQLMKKAQKDNLGICWDAEWGDGDKDILDAYMALHNKLDSKNLGLESLNTNE